MDHLFDVKHEHQEEPVWTVIIILAAIIILGCVCAWGPWDDAKHRDRDR